MYRTIMYAENKNGSDSADVPFHQLEINGLPGMALRPSMPMQFEH